MKKYFKNELFNYLKYQTHTILFEMIPTFLTKNTIITCL